MTHPRDSETQKPLEAESRIAPGIFESNHLQTPATKRDSDPSGTLVIRRDLNGDKMPPARIELAHAV